MARRSKDHNSSLKSVAANVKEYLTETSAHGFKYLVQGRSCQERLFWFLIILLAFGYSSYFISSAIREARLNPIASIIEIVNGKNIMFPAVTIFPGPKPAHLPESHLFRFVTSVLNNLDFGCPKKKLKSIEDYYKCLPVSIEPMRKDFKPLLENMIENLEAKWKKEVAEGRHVKGTTIEQMRRKENSFMRNFTNIAWRLNNLNVTEDHEIDFRQKFSDLYPDVIAIALLGQLLPNLEQLEETLLAQSNLTLSKEEEDFELEDFYKLGKLSHWLNIFELLGADNAENVLRMGDLLEFSYLGRAGVIDPYLYTFGPNGLQARSRNISDVLIDDLLVGNDDMMTAHDLVYYLTYSSQLSMQGDFKWDSGKRGKVCKGIKELHIDRVLNCTKHYLDSNWKMYLRLVKYMDQPPFARVSGTTFEKDMMEAFDIARYKVGCNMTLGTCTNNDPFVRLCNFDYVDSTFHERQLNTNDCSYFSRTFGIHGLSYTFNAGHFWDMYTNNEWNEAFFEQVFKSNDDFEDAYFHSGKKLDFFIFPDSMIKYKDGKDVTAHSLAIHHPTQFPGSSIILEPGYRYRIILTPSLITADSDVSEIPEEKRQCRFPGEGHHHQPDSIFSTYSQAGCIHECRLRQIYSELGCLPWNFPHFEKPISICPHWYNTLTRVPFEDLYAKTNADACDCPVDCIRHSYGMVITKDKLDECIAKQGRDDVVTQPEPLILKFLSDPRDYDHDNYDETKCKSGWNDKLVRVTIEMDAASIINTRRIRRTTLTDQIASLGGLVGLFTGMSMMSAVEFFVWLLKGGNKAVCQRNNSKRRSNSETPGN